MAESVFDIQKRSDIMRFITYGIVAMLLSIVHLVFLDFVSFGGITPDLLLLLCIWITMHEGQLVGLFFAFGIGIFLDVVSMDVVGTNALAKTIAAFIAGFFYVEGKTDQIMGNYKFLGIIIISTIAHNLVYFFFYIKPSEMSFMPFFLRYGISTTLYTTVFGVFMLLVKIKKKGI
jgi:rod shape-determining protein MreD